MRPHDAARVGRAVARVDTALSTTGEHLGTLLIHQALWPCAAGVGVAAVLGRAVAARTVVPRLAQRVHPALGEAAGRDTRAADALVRQRTLEVTLAPGCNMQVRGWSHGQQRSYFCNIFPEFLFEYTIPFCIFLHTDRLSSHQEINLTTQSLIHFKIQT